MWSLVEMGSIATVTYLYVTANTATVVGHQKVGSTTTTLSLSAQYLEALIFFCAICFIYFLNIIALFAQNCFLRFDNSFNKWLKAKSSVVCYYILSILGVLITHKVKNLMFSKLFNFKVFRAQLDSTQSFRIFHAFAFLSLIPSAAILYSAISLLIRQKDSSGNIIVNQLFMAYIDIIIVVSIMIILAILSTCKGENYFEEEEKDGYVINKRIAESDEIMHEAVIPPIE